MSLCYYLYPGKYSHDGSMWYVGKELTQEVKRMLFDTEEEAICWGTEYVKNNPEKFKTDGFQPGEHYELEIHQHDDESRAERGIVDWLVVNYDGSVKFDGERINEVAKMSTPDKCKTCKHAIRTVERVHKGWGKYQIEEVTRCDCFPCRYIVGCCAAETYCKIK